MGSKGKNFIILFKYREKCLTDTLAKMSQNIFAHFSVSEHSASFSLFQKKTPILVTAKGFSLLSSVYGLVRDLNFFYAFPNTPLNLLKQEKLFVLLQLCRLYILNFVGRNHFLYFFLVPVRKIISLQKIYPGGLFKFAGFFFNLFRPFPID